VKRSPHRPSGTFPPQNIGQLCSHQCNSIRSSCNITDNQSLKSPSRLDGRGPGWRNMSRQQSCVGMRNCSNNTSRFHGSSYLRESFLVGSPPLEHGLTCKSNSPLRRELNMVRQSKARRVRNNKESAVVESPSRMYAVSLLSAPS
jgi:hypothetical protein